jgi:hypothetical protein
MWRAGTKTISPPHRHNGGQLLTVQEKVAVEQQKPPMRSAPSYEACRFDSISATLTDTYKKAFCTVIMEYAPLGYSVQGARACYQTVATLYGLNAASRDTSVNPSADACAINKRSNGSR